MTTLDPPWKIRSRPCPFYSQGKCFFSRNCSFLHDVKSTPTAIRVTAPEDNKYPASDSSATASADLPHDLSLNDADGYNFEEDVDSTDEEESDVESPTIRKPVLTLITNSKDTERIEGPLSRDSVATVKGLSHGSEPAVNVPRSHSSLPKLHIQSRQETAARSSRPVPTSSHRGSIKERNLLPPFPESPAQGSASSPSSATFVNAQELEVPTVPGLPVTSDFHLADAASSSLLASRLAKSRGNPLTSPPVPVVHNDPSSPFSAGALYASYQEQDAVPPLPFAEANPETTLPQYISPTHAVPRTPSWLRPLRLTSTLTPQTDSQSSSKSNSISRIFTHNLSGSGSLSYIPSESGFSSDPLYNNAVIRDSPDEQFRRSSDPSNNIPTDTPHTIVLSDYGGYMSPFSLSRNGSVDIDMSQFPPPPVSPESSTPRSPSSQTSNSLSELTGSSPRKRPILPHIRTANPPDSEGRYTQGEAAPLGRATTSAEQFQSALERRAVRLREGSNLIASSELQHGISDSKLTNSQHLWSDSVSAGSFPAFARSQSWSTLPHTRMLSQPESLPTTSFSDSLLMQQVQSSPPRGSPRLRPSPSIPSTLSPLPRSSIDLTQSPAPNPSPRPHLLFAIAADQPAEVERLLLSGEASANETTGTGAGLLEFTVANDGLKNKTEIVKTLLKYGADPGPLNDIAARDKDMASVQESPLLAKKLEEAMNPALKYYLTRPQPLDTDSKPTLKALQDSSFAPLVRARFDIIGQDRALDELYRVLGVQSQRKGRNALVILLCGASGHGKSFLAQKVGSLLDVPTHTINMTALRSQHDLWQCLSTGVDDASPDLDLSEFLVQNQGKRCVVVLDEIEKVDDPKSLNPLLLPWDIGRCSLEQKKHTDTSKVIWIATSNLGQRLIAEHHAQWDHPDSPPTRVEYLQLATALRRGIADVLGTSLLSRVTAVLPFLPFTETEKIAIGTEAVLSHGEYIGASQSYSEMEAMVRRAVQDVNLVEAEGARSLQRVVEAHLSIR